MMVATKTKAKKSPPPPGTPQVPIVLGVIPKGDLEEVELALIDDPPGEPDRLPRPGDEEAIADTARSMREVGQLQPVMVEYDEKTQRFIRVFGRRRIKAARLNGATSILAIVVPPLKPDVRRTIVAVENIQRQNLSPAEEHLAVAELLELQAIDAALAIKAPLLQVAEWAGKASVMNDAIAAEMRASKHHTKAKSDLLKLPAVRARACELVAAMLAKPTMWVRDRMYIGRFEGRTRALILEGKLPLAHAREIAKVADPEIREDLAESYAAGGDDSTSDVEAGPLEELRRDVQKQLFALKQVPWKLDVRIGNRVPCIGCPHNSASNPGLFDHGGRASTEMRAGIGVGCGADATKSDVCTDHRCYAEKLRISKGLLAAAAKKIVDSGGKPSPQATGVLQPAAIKRRVESRRALAKSRPIPRRQASPSASETAKAAAREARAKWKEEMQRRGSAIEKKLGEFFVRNPLHWAVYVIFRQTKLFQSTQGSNEKTVNQTVQSGRMKAFLSHLAKPTVEGIQELARDAGRQYALLDEWYDGPSGMAERIAEALGCQLQTPAPSVDSFLPKKGPEMADSTRAAKGDQSKKALCEECGKPARNRARLCHKCCSKKDESPDDATDPDDLDGDVDE